LDEQKVRWDMKRKMILMFVLALFAFIFYLEVPLAVAGLHDNGDGTVSDTVTGLMWQQGDGQNDGGGYTWEEALGYCESLELPNHNDWRLPNIRELQSITDLGRYAPAIDPLFDCSLANYWSSSPWVLNPYQSWAADFNDGRLRWRDKPLQFHVRCVREDDPASCFECTGDPVELQNVTFQAVANCECTATTSITIGSQVVIKSGAIVTFKAPSITVQPGFLVEKGAVVKMGQQ